MSTRVGTDLIEIARVRRSLERYAGFRDRCFTPAEQAYCDSRRNPAQSYAGRFAAKEAVGKALGTGLLRDGIALSDIEVLRAESGAPDVRLLGAALAAYRALGGESIAIGLTHEGDVAAASCVIQTSRESPDPGSPAPEGAP